jgi:hypothetical protein
MSLRAPSIRHRVDPRDVPAEKAARRLGLTSTAFAELSDLLFARGFPRPDPTTGLYDLKAIEDWMDRRSNLTPSVMRATALRESVFAAAERRKCWATRAP